MSAPKMFQAWLVARELPSLRVVAEMRLREGNDRLEIERFIEQLGVSIPHILPLKDIYPNAIVTGEMRFGQEESDEQRNVRMLRAFLLLQEHLPPRCPANAAAHDAVEFAILELGRF